MGDVGDLKEEEMKKKDSRKSSATSSNSDIDVYHYADEEEKLSCGEQWRRYPKHVLFIVGMEFCERFSYYGMRSVLLLYLRNYLKFDDDTATAVYHAFTVLAYFTPVIGAIIADSYWGKYKTIILLSIVYIFGHIIKTIGSIPFIPSATAHVVLSMLGLFFIACGTGGIKPCVSSFGGDQFKPEQTVVRKQFFSLFYFAINAGSLISTFVTPILRADVDCYPNQTDPIFDECYALAFGVPAALMCVALILFVAGSKWYTKNPPEGSVFWRFCHCIGSGIKHWYKTPKKERTKEHWLDNAKADEKMIRDTKYVLRVFILFIPLPFFWALFDQQGSRWTLQCIELDGHLGNIHLKPDQIETLNPIFIVTLIPLFEVTLYPFLRYLKLDFTPLKRMTLGLFLAGVSFILAAILQIEIEKRITPLPGRGEYAIRILNEANCDLQIGTNDSKLTFNVNSGNISDSQNFQFINVNQFPEITLTYESCTGNEKTKNIKPTAETVYDVLFRGDADEDDYVTSEEMIIDKSEDGGGKFSFVNARIGQNLTVHITDGDPKVVHMEGGEKSEEILVDIGNTNFEVQDSDKNSLFSGSIDVEVGAVYTIVLNDTSYYTRLDLNPSSLSVAWIFPQFFIITVGEVFLSVTGLEFSYTQAPPSMKSVVTSIWLLTVSFGNIIVLIITGVQGIESQVGEFLLFAGLIFVAMIVFIILAYFYVPVDEDEFEEEMMEEHRRKARLEAGDPPDEKSLSSLDSKGKTENVYENIAFSPGNDDFANDNHYVTEL
uniref:solute carrier family 15 member 2-like n=1 Tax=Styela clava TaxID=7725 RepID=UPI00193AD240|nr:solute carrier family 15 member 2-like [Styela clava]